jgi:hypothetical protein
MRPTFILCSAALITSSALAQTSIVTGPSSSASPYVVPVGNKVTDLVSILTVGDTIGGYTFVGIPDGMGAIAGATGTFNLFINHEFTATAGGVRRAHQPAGFAGGAFISGWNVNKSNFAVNSGFDAITSTATVTNGTGGSLYNFARFCSGEIPAANGLFNATSGKGTQNRFYFTGEESGTPGRSIATDLNTGVAYQMTSLDVSAGSWENILVRPYESDTTVAIATSDGGANRVFLYVGTKQDSGNPAERAGLLNGTSYGIQVQVKGSNIATESQVFCFSSAAPARYTATFTLAAGGTAAGTTFLRPEDGAWDPANPADFYFVTTDRMSITSAGAAQTSGSRLFRLRFNDVNNVLAGGTIEALIEGTGSYPKAIEMGDNLCVVNTIQGGTRVFITEDPGNNPHTARTVMYDVATDTATVILESDRARFGGFTSNGAGGWTNQAATAPFSQDEENSGNFEASEVFGKGWFIQNMQAHYSLAAPLVEGGQVYAYFCPECVGSVREDLSTPLDAIVGAEDLAELLNNWGGTGRSDINRDGVTDAADLGALLAAWNSN